MCFLHRQWNNRVKWNFSDNEIIELNETSPFVTENFSVKKYAAKTAVGILFACKFWSTTPGGAELRNLQQKQIEHMRILKIPKTLAVYATLK